MGQPDCEEPHRDRIAEANHFGADHILAVCLIAPGRQEMTTGMRSAGTETVVANQTARSNTRSRLRVTMRSGMSASSICSRREGAAVC